MGPFPGLSSGSEHRLIVSEDTTTPGVLAPVGSKVSPAWGMHNANTLGRAQWFSAKALVSPPHPRRDVHVHVHVHVRVHLPPLQRGHEHLDATKHAGPRVSPSGNRADKRSHDPTETPRASHTSGTQQCLNPERSHTWVTADVSPRPHAGQMLRIWGLFAF